MGKIVGWLCCCRNNFTIKPGKAARKVKLARLTSWMMGTRIRRIQPLWRLLQASRYRKHRGIIGWEIQPAPQTHSRLVFVLGQVGAGSCSADPTRLFHPNGLGTRGPAPSWGPDPQGRTLGITWPRETSDIDNTTACPDGLVYRLLKLP